MKLKRKCCENEGESQLPASCGRGVEEKVHESSRKVDVKICTAVNRMRSGVGDSALVCKRRDSLFISIVSFFFRSLPLDIFLSVV